MCELGYETTKSEMQMRMERIATDERYRTFVAVRDGKVCGMIGTLTYPSFEHNDPSGRISCPRDIEDDAPSRNWSRADCNRGEGFRPRGIRRIALNTRLAREDAHKFLRTLGYERNGFRFTKIFRLSQLGTKTCCVSSDLTLAARSGNPDRFCVCEFADACSAQFATKTGAFYAAEWQTRIGGDHRVDENHSAVQLRCEKFFAPCDLWSTRSNPGPNGVSFASSTAASACSRGKQLQSGRRLLRGTPVTLSAHRREPWVRRKSRTMNSVAAGQ